MPYVFADDAWNDQSCGCLALASEEAVQDKLRRYEAVLERLDTNLTGCRATIRLTEKKGRHREQVVYLVAAQQRDVYGWVRTDSRWSASHSVIYIEAAKRALPGLVARRVAEMIAVQTHDRPTRQHSVKKCAGSCQLHAVKR